MSAPTISSEQPDSRPHSERRRPRHGPPGDVVDPYCGMRLRRSEAAATTEYRGRLYYFCLEDHRDAFLRDPDRYLQSSVARATDAGALDGDAPRADGDLRSR